MCLGHVYIVLEPVGSARLKFDDGYIMRLCVLMYRRLFGVPDVITDRRGVSKWSRRKDRYIGSLYLDIGSVPGEIGILPENREVIGTPREVHGP